jgi:arylsulfatase A-like enzyme
MPPLLLQLSAMIRLVFASLLLTAALHAIDRPNVLIFLADDMGWGDVSANGNPNHVTPSIDSLARDGVKLDRFFVCPVCSPTRAEFLTGRYHPRGGVKGVSTGQERLNLDERTLADAFKAAGYRTGAFGKWHNGSQWPYHPNARGFDEYYGFTSGHWGEYFDPPLEHNGQPVRGKGYMTDLLTDKALEFIDASKGGPFLCYVPYNVPHSPWAVPQADWARFKDKNIITSERDKAGEEIDETRCALAMVSNMDANIGRVLRRLEELKLAGNTIVIFFTDNGPNSYRWNGGMKGKKGTTDEGGVRSPFFIRWPGHLPGGLVVKEISCAIDILPTLCALSRVPRLGDKPLDGRDLSPLLKKQSVSWPDRRIFSTWGPNVSVRTQTHRLDGQGALFDMVADPDQTRNIATAQPELAQTLKQAVTQWRAKVLGNAAPAGKTGKGNKNGKGNAVDQRPIPVGYREFPRTPLPARDGEPRGGVKRSSGAPNCSYFVNWTSQEDRMIWSLDVNTAGDYAVEILYTCPLADAGSTIELAAGENRLSSKIEPGWDPPLYTNQDTIPRPAAESRMKEFHTLQAGTIHLEKGRSTLSLRATDIPGRSVMDVRQINLILK